MRGTNDSAMAATTAVANPTASTTPSTRISYARGVSCSAKATSVFRLATADQNAEHAADEREREVFDDEQTTEAPPARAERGAHVQLALAPHAAHQREVGHIGARDEEDEAPRPPSGPRG